MSTVPSFSLSPALLAGAPGAGAGYLAISHVSNRPAQADFEIQIDACERDLRQAYSGCDRSQLAALPNNQVNIQYFKRFKKTYAVLLQLESVVLKGKSIPRFGPLVEAMFAVELQTQLATAGHDLRCLQGSLCMDLAQGGEMYTLFNGQPQAIKPGDLFVADTAGPISSLIYGPDQRSPITPETEGVAYVAYAPPGIPPEAVASHLAGIRRLVLAACPQAVVEYEQVLLAPV
jgi:DNA/RNA-binding domain of Phe-tRNA-synthetase-like protein